MSEKLKKQLRNVLPTLLQEDKEFRGKLYGLLMETFTTNKDLKLILKEIRNLRKDFNTQFQAFNQRFETFDQRMTELRQDFNIRMKELRKDFNTHMEDLETHMSALGARWGISSERAFRRGLSRILEDRFHAKVQKWEVYDENGTVYGHPSVVEMDVVLKDGTPLLVEIKASIKKSDIAELIKVGRLYEQEEGVQPDLAVMSPFIREEAKDFALKHKIKVLSSSRTS